MEVNQLKQGSTQQRQRSHRKERLAQILKWTSSLCAIAGRIFDPMGGQ
jgi:hypothetical protein